mgnify:CR=1 FL=1
MIEIFHILEVKNHVKGLDAVIFDLDDTLYSEKEYVRSGYKKISELFPKVDDAEEKLLRYEIYARRFLKSLKKVA